MRCEAKLYNPNGCGRRPVKGKRVCLGCSANIIAVVLQHISAGEYATHARQEQHSV